MVIFVEGQAIIKKTLSQVREIIQTVVSFPKKPFSNSLKKSWETDAVWHFNYFSNVFSKKNEMTCSIILVSLWTLQERNTGK